MLIPPLCRSGVGVGLFLFFLEEGDENKKIRCILLSSWIEWGGREGGMPFCPRRTADRIVDDAAAAE